MSQFRSLQISLLNKYQCLNGVLNFSRDVPFDFLNFKLNPVGTSWAFVLFGMLCLEHCKLWVTNSCLNVPSTFPFWYADGSSAASLRCWGSRRSRDRCPGVYRRSGPIRRTYPVAMVRCSPTRHVPEPIWIIYFLLCAFHPFYAARHAKRRRTRREM